VINLITEPAPLSLEPLAMSPPKMLGTAAAKPLWIVAVGSPIMPESPSSSSDAFSKASSRGTIFTARPPFAASGSPTAPAIEFSYQPSLEISIAANGEGIA
jgi:hypothetical protein